MTCRRVWVGWGLVLLVTVVGAAAAPPPESPPASEPPARWVDLGSVRVDTANRCIVLPGRVNQVEGAIELLACGPGGKTHESIFVLDVAARDLQAALLLLDAAPRAFTWKIDPTPPGGSPVEVAVARRDAGDTTTSTGWTPAGDMVLHRGRSTPMNEARWVYTGSMVEDGQLAADREQSLIATYWDPFAILNLANECGADDTMLAAHREALPPLGTPILLRLTPRPARNPGADQAGEDSSPPAPR